MDYNELVKLPREKLVEAALKLNLRVHHKAKPETIAKQIMEASLKKMEKPAEIHQLESDPRLLSKPATFHTIEQVEKILAPIKNAQPKFTTKYFDEFDNETTEDVRYMKMECLGAAETINLSVPLRQLRICADKVKQGRITLATHTQAHFEPGVATGPNAYTNVVLG